MNILTEGLPHSLVVHMVPVGSLKLSNYMTYLSMN